MATTPSGNKVELQVGVDVSPMKQGLREGELEIKKFGDTVATQASKASRSIDSLGTASQETSAKLSRSQQAYVANLQRVVAAEEAGGRNTVEYQRKLAALRNVPAEFSEPLLKQLEAVQKGQAGAGKGLADFQQNLRATRAQANLTANALRQVPAQFTDIVVSLASGQAPLTVLLQQGGQLKDVFGGVGAAVRALGGYVLGLINPFTILAGVIGSVAVGYALGSKETDAFNNALITTGRAAGKTLGELQALSKTVSDNAGVTKGAAAEALTLAVNSGLVGDAVGIAADAAVRLQKTLGVGLDKTIAQFKSLGEDPLKAALKLNETTHFLTLATYEQIKALEDQGRGIEAARIAQEAYADSIKNRTGEVVQNLGYFEAAWVGVKDAAKGALDVLKDIGRDASVPTPESMVAQTRQRISELEQKAAPGRGIFSGISEADKAELETLRFRLTAYEGVVAKKQEEARLDAEAARRVELKARFDQRDLQYLDDKQKATRVLIALQGKLQEEVDAGAITFEQASKQLEAARKSLADKGQDDRKNQLDLGIEQIKARLSESISILDSQQKIFDAHRAAGLVGEQEYYDKIRGFITSRSNLELRATEDIIKLRQRTTLNDKDAIDNQREIVKLTAERTKQVREANTQGQVLSIQEQAAAVARVRAYEQARNAAQTFFDAQDLGFKREIDGLNRGDMERRRIGGINQISDRYAEQRRAASERLQLASLAGPPTPDARQQYDQQVALIDEFLGKSLESWDRYYADLKTAQADWTTGAKRSLENYSDSVANVAGQTESLLTNAFKGAEDAFVEFTRTGQLSFSAMADSIISDLIRIQIRRQITGELAQAAQTSGVVGSIASFFANAKGGVYNTPSLSQYRNGVYDSPKTFAFAKGAGIFAEAGPEAIMPLTRTPDGNLGVRATGGTAGVTVNIIESSNRGGEVQRRNDNGANVIDVFVARVKAEVANDIRRGSGPVPAAMADTYGLNRAPSAY